METKNSPENSFHDKWSLLLQRVIARAPQKGSLSSSCFRASAGTDVTVEYFGDATKKILVTIPEIGGYERVSVYLDALGEVESARTSIVRERRFSNGVHGPGERGLHSHVELRQDFGSDGSVSERCFDFDHSVAQLYVHSQSTVGGSASTTANTSLEYGCDETGIFPSIEKEVHSAIAYPRKIPHFFGRYGISVFENRLKEGADAEGKSDVATIAEGGASYSVGFGKDRVEVSIGGIALAVFPVRQNLDIDRLIDLLVRDCLVPAEENAQVIGTVVAQVDGVLDR